MATIIRTQVSIERDTTLPRDWSVNTWHFLSNSGDPVADCSLIDTDLGTFYGTIDAFLAVGVSTVAHVKHYDLTDPSPRAPIATQDYSLTSSSSAAFPAEVAIVLSYRASIGSGENVKRARGRIFLGPLAVATSSSTVGDVRVDSSVRSTIVGAAHTMQDALIVAGVPWVTFSPTTAGPPPWSELALTSAARIVQHGYVDDAFDTMRSRGLPPSTRTTFDI